MDDAEAVYPLVVDPWLQQAKFVASDGANFGNFGNFGDFGDFGNSVSGDTVVVGVYRYDAATSSDAGSAYVFDLVLAPVATDYLRAEVAQVAATEDVGATITLEGPGWRRAGLAQTARTG